MARKTDKKLKKSKNLLTIYTQNTNEKIYTQNTNETASNSGLSAGSRVISGQAGSLGRSDCGVKLPGNGRPRPLPPPTRDVVKFWVVRGPSSDHSGLGSTPKLNFSVIVTPACAADTQTEVLVARGAPERGLPALVGHVSVGGGRVFLQVLVVLGATDHAEVVACGGRGTFGVVLSHALQRRSDCWARASRRWTAVR